MAVPQYSDVFCESPTFWHQGPVSWNTIFSRPQGRGRFGDDSSALDLLCAVFLLLHQLHLSSSGLRSWRLGTAVRNRILLE